jgi:malate dehydrogenase (oxaloacetate-decarboxylating)
MTDDLAKLGHIKEPPAEMLELALSKAIDAVKK